MIVVHRAAANLFYCSEDGLLRDNKFACFRATNNVYLSRRGVQFNGSPDTSIDYRISLRPARRGEAGRPWVSSVAGRDVLINVSVHGRILCET